jgi:broad specificity polyphosphatase/5'/3'-nucleotidase SurE
LATNDDGYSAIELRALEVGVDIEDAMTECANYGDFSGCTDLDAATAVRVKLEDDGTYADPDDDFSCTGNLCQLIKARASCGARVMRAQCRHVPAAART